MARIPPNAPPADSVKELFEGLLEFKWRDITFPTTSFSVRLRQDLAQHKFCDRDGAHIEPTGRAPLEFTATIPFCNGIVPGKNETWGILYPTAYRALFLACADRSAGTLVHPEHGAVPCNVVSLDAKWTAERRGGNDVEVVWIESTDNPKQASKLFAAKSPISEATAAALDLDAQLTQIKPPLPALPKFQPTFASTMRQIQGAVDQVALLQRSTIGKLDQIDYRCAQILDAVGRLDQPLNWPMRQTCQRMRSATNQLRKVIGLENKSVALYVVPYDGTLGLIAASTGATVSELVLLNPGLCKAAVVPENSIVRYYKQELVAIGGLAA